MQACYTSSNTTYRSIVQLSQNWLCLVQVLLAGWVSFAWNLKKRVPCLTLGGALLPTLWFFPLWPPSTWWHVLTFKNNLRFHKTLPLNIQESVSKHENTRFYPGRLPQTFRHRPSACVLRFNVPNDTRDIQNNNSCLFCVTQTVYQKEKLILGLVSYHMHTTNKEHIFFPGL